MDPLSPLCDCAAASQVRAVVPTSGQDGEVDCWLVGQVARVDALDE